MWTTEHRGRYGSRKLRYPSDLTDLEWALVAPLIPSAKRGGNKRAVDVREVVTGLMYIPSTGRQWAAIPKDLRPLEGGGGPQRTQAARADLEQLKPRQGGDCLAAIVIFCNEVKGKSALALSRDMNV